MDRENKVLALIDLTLDESCVDVKQDDTSLLRKSQMMGEWCYAGERRTWRGDVQQTRPLRAGPFERETMQR